MNTSYRSSTFAVEQGAAAVEPRRHFDYFAVRLPNPLMSAAFGFAMSVCLLAASAAGMRSGIIGFFGLTGLIVVLFPHAVVSASARNGLLWLYPAWALFSSQWSIDPDRTVHQASLLLPTIAAGIILGGMPHRRAIGAGAALALGSYIVYSVGYGASTMFSDTGGGGSALTGITTGKNYFGHIAATSVITAPFLLTFARGRWTTAMIALTAVIVAISGFALVKSYATGSMLATLIAFMMLTAVMLFNRLSWQFRVLLIVTIVGVLVLYINFGEELQEHLFAMVLQRFNKDVSLTGRTVLWDHADRLIAEHRFLGYGYGAFWYYTNPEAWTIWRMMGVKPMSGFNFHNTMRDTLIETGWVGLGIYLASFGYALVRRIVRTLARGDLTSAVCVAFLTYFVVRMPVESTGIGAVSIDTLLIVTFLSVTLVEDRKPVETESVVEPRTAPHEIPEERRAAYRPVRPVSLEPRRSR